MSTKNYQLYWGETHHNTYQRPEQTPSLDRLLEKAQSHLDFYAAAYYMCRMDPVPLKGAESNANLGTAKGHPGDLLQGGRGGWRGLFYEYQKDDVQLTREWLEVEAATRARHRPGSFVTFPGFEWQGDLRWGDHNVFFKNEGSPIYTGPTLAGLYDHIRDREAFAIPHHTGYRPGCRAPQWSHCDESLSPFAEIYSVHGCSERDGLTDSLRTNGHMGPGIGGGTYVDALKLGLHLGAVGSTDNWTDSPGRWGHGLMGCWAEELTRESLWDAFGKRRVYAVTGDRIQLRFTCNGNEMGSILPSAEEAVLRVSGTGCDKIERVEILRNEEVISVVTPRSGDASSREHERNRYRIRIEAGWGPKPGEIPTGDKRWSGKLELKDGRFLDWEPCWLHTDQSPPRLSDRTVEFTLNSPQEQASEDFQNGYVFEFESMPDSRLRLEADGRVSEYSIEELCRGSQLVSFDEESMQAIKKHTTWNKKEFPRWSTPFAFAHKIRISDAIPKSEYAFEVETVDRIPTARSNYYRARVIQRNGQRAWSSPIWLG